jgi:uncharacterized protein YbjT (DUF2867 family)
VKLALLGATGYVGADVLRTALAAGLEVKALVRDPASLVHKGVLRWFREVHGIGPRSSARWREPGR